MVVALSGHTESVLLLGAGLAAGCALFGFGFVLWRRKRWIEDTPTARVRSMPLGRVELFGKAREKAELAAPITQAPCVYYRYRVQELVRSGRNRRWQTVASSDSSGWPFYVEDGTGSVLVDPRGAVVDIRCAFSHEVRPGDAAYRALEDLGLARHTWFGTARRMRVQEWHIAAGAPLYVLGVAQDRPGLGRERRQRIAERLAATKRDPEAMARFDADGDGQISADEWEVARRLVVNEVQQESVEDRVVIGRDPQKAAPFYVSNREERAIVRSLAWRAGFAVFGGSALALGSLAGMLALLGILGRT